jgi:tetraacyldisaccharide 4'-kinase
VSLVDDWYQQRLTVKTALLVPTAQLYGALFSLFRPRPAREHRFGRPIVVIGNLTVGGTGKTPLTLHLVNEFLRRRYKVGVVSRGYPISPASPVVVNPDMSADKCGDEPLLYARSGVPTVVCAARVQAVRALLSHAPDIDVVLADDALQHTALARDIELCVVDGRLGFGNGYTLPAGPLREPATRLRAVDALVINGPRGYQTLAHPSTFSMDVRISDLWSLDGANVGWEALPSSITLVAGIGQPGKFFDAATQVAPQLASAPRMRFPDHHAFSASELNAIPTQALLMTEKDAVRCAKIAAELNKRIFYTTTVSTLTPSLVDWLIGQLEQKGYGRKTV